MRANSDAPADATATPFNPLVALQTLLSADVMSVKQRIKAAQQLEEYFRLLSPTPGLLLSYEPYLPLLTDVMVTPIKGGQELQTSVLAMLQILSAHNPTGFGDWIARNAQLGNEPWLVQWSYALLLQTEKIVPREEDGEKWEDSSAEFKQFDMVFARVMQMWRTLLDHTAEVALVDQLVKCLQALPLQTGTDQWRTLMLKKLQAHFVDIADVLIGWMMSTGPHSPLREEILTLLDNFGRLWADNSVFSLQLMNSFADEIVNLCDSWSDHQEGDDDRLSTLVTCFMMVAQCVPDLALSGGEGLQSPFERVLRRVASCSQPEYSIFCVANCSDYLVSISNARHNSFAPFSAAIVGFLLHHCAVQSRLHDCEVTKLSTVLENACKLASTNFSRIADPLLERAAVIGVLDDDIPSRIVKKGGQPKRVKVMECLFQLKCANAVTYSTQLCLHLIQLGGIEALKVFGARALQRLSGRNGEKGNSYFVFAATCFILVSRNPERLKLLDDDTTHVIAILDLISTKLEKQNQRHRQLKVSPRQLCLVLKMACAFIGAVSKWIIDRSDALETLNGVSLRMLQLALGMLPSETVVARDHRLSVETLHVVHALLSRTTLLPVIPRESCRGLLIKVTQVVRSSSVKVRESCIQVLEVFQARMEACEFAGETFDVLLDLLLDPSPIVKRRIMSGALNEVALAALLKQEKLRTYGHISRPLHPSFVGADFANILSRFQSRECDESEWNRVCRSIMNRTSPHVAINNSGILLGAIRQAAAWCVQNRLRTHFGGPAQSFASIERLLQEYADEIQQRNHTELPLALNGKQLPNWLMLEFVNALEMCITSAICTTDMDQSNPESEEYKAVVFFRTNKVVCDDWLNRIRPFLVEMAKNAPNYELWRYHSHAAMTICYSRLSRAMSSFAAHGPSDKIVTELRQAEKELDAALFMLCRCHCDAKDADSIIGIQRWSESVASALIRLYQQNKGRVETGEEYCKLPLFRWLSALRYEAEMRYEEAAAEYESLLEPVLTREGFEAVSPAKLFESPMTNLRISPSALLGCFKQHAKCYAALRQWTKLRQLVTQFVSVANSLMDYDYPIEEIQSIFDCSDAWSSEIGTISNLEASTDRSNDVKDSRATRVAQALRVWDVVSEANTGQRSAESLSNSVADKLWRDLVPLALQPAPWHGYAGEKVGKRAEETLLRMAEAAKKSSLSTGFCHNEALTNLQRLNPELYDCGTWGQPFSSLHLGCSGWNADAECLHLTGVARLARRQHNLDFAQSLLREAASLEKTSRVSAMALNYEKAKLLELVGMDDEGRQLLEAQCETSLEVLRLDHSFSGQENVAVRSILHLAKSITDAENTKLLSPVASRILESASDPATSVDSEEVDAAAFPNNFQSESAHKCFQAAIAVSPKSPKAWAHYSHWCYERGKREVEQISEQNGYIHLDSEDEAQISTLLDEIGIVESDHDSVIRAFCHFLDNDELFSQRHGTLQQLCTELAPQDHSRDAVDRLTELQQACHSKALRFHTLAARGYGKYLSVLFSDSGCSISRQEITMVVLRLLGLLTTYGAEREVVAALEDVFSDGPVDPWSHVIPQLIARAHHPISAVSSLVCLILKRLAHHSPHSIVYPVVVDSMEPHATFSSPQEERGTASNTFATVLQELQNVSAGQVEGVRLLIFELRRISILWDEAWISTLVKLSADVSRRTSTLEKEANRVEKNASLSAKEKSELAQRKLVAIMKPIYVSIERLWKETCGGIREQHTVTPHERKFLKDFGGVIDKAMENFRHCCASESWGNAGSVKNPEELWQPFAEILKALMNATGRREQLPLHDISPAMASTSRQLALTNMPGAVVGKTAGQVEPITIHRVDASVTVLRTKTKPKSLKLIGSDGKTYKYLLKAREDLRLDERIMQYLRVTNQFLQADDAAAARDLSAQSYSVIPLSRNAGLIQMVPDVVPLFQVYTARNDASGRTPQDPVAASSAQQPPPPTAQFYAKLKQHGITNVAPNNRSLWPPNVLRQVYQELVAQRPRNVLQQKILLRSEDLRESWIKSTRLSKSLAVMSVLGYIVGLGDRHLDNILLCVNSGDIVHIDHNVCFDKGRRLKVPEIVPFRLTPMLQDALGFTGVEGRFRMAFETTLRIVRSDNVREALLTLFEAFVYGPLVDWIAEDRRQGRSGDLKARLEVNVNLSLFLSRAEERRQDTISFGRQYEQHADVISRALNGSQVPFETLLEQRKQLLSLEVEEQTRLREVASVEAELSKHQSAEQIKRAELESTTTRFNDITTKVSSFADECLARHQQIEVWRQKSVAFAESDPVTQLSAVTTAVDTLSFQTVHETLCSVMEKLRSVGRQRQLLDALESNCRSVDADVARLRFEIEKIATYLVPYLSYYGYQRKELDAYLESEVKVAGKDVYFKWWSVCSEYLRGLAGEQNKGTANTIVTCSAPSKENVAESTMVLNRLSDLPLYLNAQSNEEKETSCISQADQLLEDVSNALSAMKLSNAQGQRLMKLAGASWIIEVMEQLNDESCVSNAEYIFTPALKAPARFGVVVAVTQACSTLLDLVSTPKGSMKRLRASELLASQRDKSMDGFNEILQEVGSFAVVLQEEFVSNVYGRQMDECGGLLERVKVMRTTPDGRKVLGMVLASTSAVKDTHSSIEVMLAKFPAVRSLLTAGFAVTQKISSLVDSLYQLSVLSGEEVERIKSSSSASWIELVLIIAELYTGTDEDKVEKVRTIWSSHVDGFVSNCLVKLLRYQLASVISSEWKFDFCALDESTSKLQTRWADYFCSQIPDILPSTLANLSTATPETQTNDVTKSVVELMSVCEEWWTYQWSKSQAHAWTQRVSSIRIRHAGRLRYAAWLSTTMPAQGDAASLSRTQLLAFLSSQVPQLNALLTDQVTVEASVLELAQQLGYLASNMGDASDESLHACVQSCYDNVAGLFDYGRTLADLVQGISVIETSSMPDTEKIQLEVDVVGTNILQSASTATLEMRSMHEEVKKMTTHVQELQGNLKQKKTMYDALASRKRAVETEFHSFCNGNMDAVLKITRVLSKSIKEMRLLLMGFDKAKTPSKQSQVAAGTIRARDSLSPERPASNVMAGFSFMENDRLVQILLRSIRYVNHLQQLEGVLEKHGDLCASLRGAVVQLDRALRDFDTQADQLLTGNNQGVDVHESSRVYLLLQLLLDLIEALRVVKDESPLAEDTPMLLIKARDLVRGCVKQFFEATEMADRLSSNTVEASRRASGVVSMPDEVDVEEQTDTTDDSVALGSGNSVVMDVSSDNCSHGTGASTLRNVEEKSQYGLQVLKRIEEKLSGTVTDMADAPLVLTVEQQASWLIDEATKTDNLCVMYEGWTPWI
ncbi:FATC domain-containing protein [Phytophthora infestans]|uniref:non-specific serine/threonine protein kinase n=1 Tax=Phytophthora infestans TaxID=4787 RepID=A0A8S9UQD5_PHYIN|nr:FATC domain-containing protein [Phytophthora infestans]